MQTQQQVLSDLTVFFRSLDSCKDRRGPTVAWLSAAVPDWLLRTGFLITNCPPCGLLEEQDASDCLHEQFERNFREQYRASIVVLQHG